MSKQSVIDRVRGVRNSRGQVMVLFALLLPVLVGMMGIGIDTANLFQARREIQSAADLAALAGASQLPDNMGAASSVASDIAAQNGYSGSEVAITAPYDGDDNKIEVAITQDVGLFFMPVLGLSSATVSARSVASHEINAGLAVFGKKDTHCWTGTITWNGNGITVDGSVHSNSGITFPGSGNTVTGDMTYKVGAPAYPSDGWTDCTPHVSMTGSNPGIELEPDAWQDWPVVYVKSDFPCTYNLGSDPNLERDGNWWVDGTMLPKKQLKPGVICYDGSNKLFMQENGVSGNVTFRANRIDIGGTNTNFTAYKNGVLFYSEATNFPALELDPVGGTWEGMIYNRRPTGTTQGGQVDINGSSGFRLNGTIIAWAVKLNGSNWSIFGNMDSTFEPMRLVE